MAYSGACNGCPRVQYFSSPDLRYRGRPLGVSEHAGDSADSVRALNDAAPVIANWRHSRQLRRRAVR